MFDIANIHPSGMLINMLIKRRVKHKHQSHIKCSSGQLDECLPSVCQALDSSTGWFIERA